MMEKNIFVSEISKMAIFKKYIVCKYYKKKTRTSLINITKYNNFNKSLKIFIHT